MGALPCSALLCPALPCPALHCTRCPRRSQSPRPATDPSSRSTHPRQSSHSFQVLGLLAAFLTLACPFFQTQRDTLYFFSLPLFFARQCACSRRCAGHRQAHRIFCPACPFSRPQSDPTPPDRRPSSALSLPVPSISVAADRQTDRTDGRTALKRTAMDTFLTSRFSTPPTPPLPAKFGQF